MSARPINISLNALGGQGGGVLADWLVAVARKAEWIAQATSVPGVAQRTGATVYYVEIFPQSAAAPVLALMPSRGDVDLVLASELMEAGRAINRGFVTPERTTLVTTTSRVYAVSEKSGVGDARKDASAVISAAEASARHVIMFDMEEAAAGAGSHMSAVMLGAAAASGALPFARAMYEAVIGEGGLAVSENLAGFAAGYARAQQANSITPPPPSVETEKLLAEGRRRLADYQDQAYAELYGVRLSRFAKLEKPGGALTRELARYLALWMSYEDTIRVADLKTRGDRFDRVRGEVRAEPAQLMLVTEYLHPRVEEIADAMPAWLGAFVLRTGWTRRAVSWMFARGRHVTTSKLYGFLQLYLIARLRFMRRSTLRFRNENGKINAWLDRIEATARTDYELAVEIARCQRLIKGYGDTYDRGWENFQALMAQAEHVGASGLERLRAAALADDEGRARAEALAA